MKRGRVDKVHPTPLAILSVLRLVQTLVERAL
jgi:hypothetical protein